MDVLALRSLHEPSFPSRMPFHLQLHAASASTCMGCFLTVSEHLLVLVASREL